MAKGLALDDTVFSAGQNEGIERAVLPLPQLSYVQNARMRKGARWGKRYGNKQAAAATDTQGVLIGSGTGAVRTIGSGFGVVDDQCVVFDSVASAWTSAQTIAGKVPRIAGAVSGWQPDRAYYPVPQQSTAQLITNCAQCYGLGYLWTATVYLDPANVATADGIVRVVGTNPADGTLAYQKDFVAATAAQGGNVQPRLLLCGSSVILTYVSRPNNAAAFVAGRRLTTLTGGFGAESTIVAPGAPFNIYDAAPQTNVFFLVAVTGTFLVVQSNFSISSTNAGIAANVSLSILGAVGLPVYITAVNTTGAPQTTTTTVSVYNGSTFVLIATAIVEAHVFSVVLAIGFAAYSTLLPGGGVRCVFGYIGDTPTETVPDERHFSWRDVSDLGVNVSALVGRQYRFQPISRPFTVGTQIYVWATTPDVAVGFGYATLLRLPYLSEYSGLTGTVNNLSCPIEMSAQDFLIRTSSGLNSGGGVVAAWDFMRGLPLPAQISASATYTFCAPTMADVPDTSVPFTHDFRVIQAKHFTDNAASRSVLPIVADGSSLLPGGVFTRITRRGAVEESFALTPAIYTLVKSGAGGALSPSVTYQYVCVYRARGDNGRFEAGNVSAISAITMGPGDSQVTLQIFTNAVSARPATAIEIYRTLGNGTTFFLVDTIDGSMQTGPLATYVDLLADTTIAKHKTIYVQVGQTLANCFPPPSRFGCAGGQRIFLGGLLRNDVVQASKLILGDQSPSFADSDAFRIVLPAACTGAAWLDTLALFTADAIYIVSGDGPDDAGNGDFGTPSRLPGSVGCIEPRSVIATDDGVFFQSSRGLYLLPRGFGAPVPVGDTVLDTLAAYPIITSVAVLVKKGEHVIRWSCVDTLAAANGVQIVYDLAHKAWSVDTIVDTFNANTNWPAVSISTWVDGEIISAGPAISAQIAFKSGTSTFDDAGSAYQMTLRTGDIRPFGQARPGAPIDGTGLVAHGPMQRMGLLSELRAACTVNVTRSSDRGQAAAARAFTGIAPDPLVGQNCYTQVDMGATELRSVSALRLQFDETSTGEGMAFIGFALEHGQSEGMRLDAAADRIV